MAAARRNQRDNDDSTVIYDIGQVRQVAVYEDRRYAYERTGRAGAEQEGTSPKPAATAGAEHVENTPASHSPERPAVADADVYQVVDLEMVNECRTDTDEAADATVANADVTSDQLQPHTQGALVKSPSTMELLDAADNEEPAVGYENPEALPLPQSQHRRAAPPRPSGPPQVLISTPSLSSTTRPARPVRPPAWRPSSELHTAVVVQEEEAETTRPDANLTQKRPSTHHAWSYLACLICFPMGVASWMKAEESRKMLIERNFFKARTAGDDAKGLSQLGIGLFVSLVIIFILWYFTTTSKVGSL
ncbi:uncharacterized protein LOC135826282 [Sycon ciliatum]|uniref:uncharacterized protein LOC135826282 n=1 Tax=Sycon ciliatum TaxID=27933 RepID=UPI0031F69A2C